MIIVTHVIIVMHVMSSLCLEPTIDFVTIMAQHHMSPVGLPMLCNMQYQYKIIKTHVIHDGHEYSSYNSLPVLSIFIISPIKCNGIIKLMITSTTQLVVCSWFTSSVVANMLKYNYDQFPSLVFLQAIKTATIISSNPHDHCSDHEDCYTHLQFLLYDEKTIFTSLHTQLLHLPT